MSYEGPLHLAPVESPWTTPPAHPLQTAKHINGQLCVWDPDPAEEWGQVWIPVCKWCRRGPLDRDQVVCGACPPAPFVPVWERVIFGEDA